MKLTNNFTLEELLASDYATRHEVEEQFNPSNAVIENLRELCKNILQPLRTSLGVPIIITSGYRCPKVNKGIGGAATSQHVLGQAADIKVIGLTPLQLCKRIKNMNLPFDQLIEEFGVWTHISYSPRNRRQILQAKKVGGKTVYEELSFE